MKKVKLVERSIRLQKQHIEEIKRWNDMLLFMNCPNGASSDLAKDYFALEPRELLQKTCTQVDSSASSGISNIKVLVSAPDSVLEAQKEV